MFTVRLRRIALVLALVLTAAACSDESSVGSGVDLSVSDQAEGLRLGETTTTTTTEPTDTGALAIGETTTTTAPTTTTTAAPEQPAITITINSDTSGTTQFDPSAARVFVGSLVAWTNADSVPRSIEFDDRSLNSGMIQPGETYLYRADRVGQFNYTDGTRPYAVGTLEVIPQ